MSKIHVLHENDEWVVPLEAAFRKQGLPFELWFLDDGSVDLSTPPPPGVFCNRMSASAHTRGNRFAPELTHVVLNWLERYDRRVINPTRALYLEISKVAQYAALEAAGIAAPRTIAAVGRTQVIAAASQFGVPLILKPNRGGKGQDVQRFDALDDLVTFVDQAGEAAPIDGVWLVQEYVRAARPVITRCEFIGGRFFYAVEVDTSEGFELCPADGCAVDDATAEPTEKFRILEGFDDPVIGAYERFLADNRIEVAGIEFIRRTDGSIVTYDVNTNTNYNPRAEARAGRDAMGELARFLGRALAAEQARAS